ncbi:FemAB family XrtA/PEP-CTERM system-associated protein [Novosphingobium tardum]|uniref:FemAB family XrtA/PEP-CTERM system-associated protein n=1 Tax=Novosphingobium tardum TaxID=1538021 RepID=A0ABV8RQH8_9SPHN
MNAPFTQILGPPELVDWRDVNERAAVTAFVADHPAATPFHRPEWLDAIVAATGHRLHVLVVRRGPKIAAVLPVHEVHSGLFGRALVSSGFAVGGGILGVDPYAVAYMTAAAEELAQRLACPGIELRGGALPPEGAGWSIRSDAHAGFAATLAADDEAQLMAIPRKQRAEVRKGLSAGLSVRVGVGAEDRAMHHLVFARSVHNLGTPVFPRRLFGEVLDRFGPDAEILTVLDGGEPVASVLSLYHRGVVMPYWGGGTTRARNARANDLMYFALMRRARERGCKTFDFGRSKIGSGAYHFKRNWGFTPEPLAYAQWSSPGLVLRDVDPLSPRHRLRITAWRRLPARVADALGPLISNGLA